MGEAAPGELLALARDAAARAGQYLAESQPGLDPEADVSAKSTPTDVVTRLDVEAEQIVRDVLLAARPSDTVLGEEGGESAGGSTVRWVVDPLDGSVNYLYGVPSWAVSVAAQVDGETTVGVVAVPPLRRTYWAVRGGGSFRDGVRLQASAAGSLSMALLATGFAYAEDVRARQGRALARLLGQVRDVRRLGAAAVDLCLLADGTVDAYYERGLNEWDHAAGALIAVEAGARVLVDGDLVAAAGPALFDDFVRLLADAGA